MLFQLPIYKDACAPSRRDGLLLEPVRNQLPAQVCTIATWTQAKRRKIYSYVPMPGEVSKDSYDTVPYESSDTRLGRYSAEPVLDDTALVGRLRYVLAHGVKEGLVERSAEWPGLTCLPQLLGPARRLFQWYSWTKRWSKRGREDTAAGEGRFAEQIAEPVELEVAPLPCWEGRNESFDTFPGHLPRVHLGEALATP